jgi:hypothetical protein
MYEGRIMDMGPRVRRAGVPADGAKVDARHTLGSMPIGLLPFLVVNAALGVGPAGVYASWRGDRELLRLVRDGCQANAERVYTWCGRAEVTTHTDNRGYDHRQIKSEVEFAYDRQRQATRWNWLTAEDVIETNGKKRASKPQFVNKLLKDGRVHRFGPYDTVRKARVYTLNIDAAGGFRPVNTSDDFDPMVFLRSPVGTHAQPIVDMLDYYYKHGEIPDVDMEVTRKDDKVALQLVDSSIVRIYEFDLSQGCTLISYRGSDPEVTVTWKYEYEEIDGAFVPKRITYGNENRTGDKPTKRVRDVYFLQNTVNRPVPESEFAFERLGVQSGDLISDRLIGVTYAYKETPPLPEPDQNDMEPDSVALQGAQENMSANQVPTAVTGDTNQNSAASRWPVADMVKPARSARGRVSTPVILSVACIVMLAVYGVTALVRRKETSDGREEDV